MSSNSEQIRKEAAQVGRLFDWSARHVQSTLCVCWAAQAALYHSYGLPKYALAEKCFGIFEQEALLPGHPLLNGLDLLTS